MKRLLSLPDRLASDAAMQQTVANASGKNSQKRIR
jgi:hypothetical protein